MFRVEARAGPARPAAGGEQRMHLSLKAGLPRCPPGLGDESQHLQLHQLRRCAWQKDRRPPRELRLKERPAAPLSKPQGGPVSLAILPQGREAKELQSKGMATSGPRCSGTVTAVNDPSPGAALLPPVCRREPARQAPTRQPEPRDPRLHEALPQAGIRALVEGTPTAGPLSFHREHGARGRLSAAGTREPHCPARLRPPDPGASRTRSRERPSPTSPRWRRPQQPRARVVPGRPRGRSAQGPAGSGLPADLPRAPATGQTGHAAPGTDASFRYTRGLRPRLPSSCVRDPAGRWPRRPRRPSPNPAHGPAPPASSEQALRVREPRRARTTREPRGKGRRGRGLPVPDPGGRRASPDPPSSGLHRRTCGSATPAPAAPPAPTRKPRTLKQTKGIRALVEGTPTAGPLSFHREHGARGRLSAAGTREPHCPARLRPPDPGASRTRSRERPSPTSPRWRRPQQPRARVVPGRPRGRSAQGPAGSGLPADLPRAPATGQTGHAAPGTDASFRYTRGLRPRLPSSCVRDPAGRWPRRPRRPSPNPAHGPAPPASSEQALRVREPRRARTTREPRGKGRRGRGLPVPDPGGRRASPDPPSSGLHRRTCGSATPAPAAPPAPTRKPRTLKQTPRSAGNPGARGTPERGEPRSAGST
ncbi:basic proline-rich protein-like [Enhydra lutris kenyoni]|uniref:Basic proline-rich protein-like n=1 Tax=Enhydra lutris kenyoni TaxID=391180 RepID=A0A2Y9K9I0_ENHLU|nr:basic proline-rich protein-like [Enhydra lutris kenyoni]